MSGINKASRWIYRAGRFSRDIRAVERSVQTGSPKPLLKRVVRKAAGRTYGRLMRRVGL
jgi:hypothetical protein